MRYNSGERMELFIDRKWPYQRQVIYHSSYQRINHQNKYHETSKIIGPHSIPFFKLPVSYDSVLFKAECGTKYKLL